MFNKRILKEESDYLDNPIPGVSITNYGIYWDIEIRGPQNSPYKDEKIKIKADLQNYPYDGPKFHFETPIFHPNVSQHGDLAPEVVGVGVNQWSPKTKMVELIQRVLAILANPSIDDASNPEASELYKTNKEKYAQKASAELKLQQH